MEATEKQIQPKEKQSIKPCSAPPPPPKKKMIKNKNKMQGEKGEGRRQLR